MMDEVEDLANALSKLISSVKNGDSEGRQNWSIEDRVWQKAAAELKVDTMIENCVGVLREQLDDPVEDWRRPEVCTHASHLSHKPVPVSWAPSLWRACFSVQDLHPGLNGGINSAMKTRGACSGLRR